MADVQNVYSQLSHRKGQFKNPKFVLAGLKFDNYLQNTSNITVQDIEHYSRLLKAPFVEVCALNFHNVNSIIFYSALMYNFYENEYLETFNVVFIWLSWMIFWLWRPVNVTPENGVLEL